MSNTPWGPCPVCGEPLTQFNWNGRNFLTGASRTHLDTHDSNEVAEAMKKVHG